MTGQIVHRGPDAEGLWSDASCGIGLGHRRLAIVDLSPGGSQPMVSASGRYLISFNGENYNYLELRADLDKSGITFRSQSDTEVLLAAIEYWGLESALRRFNGMFAFALWDRLERTLSLARDRLGKKPLYYGRVGPALVFASELKALRAVPGFCSRIDRGALTAFLRHNYVPAPYCIYEGFAKLEAAHVATFAVQNGHVERVGKFAYWSPVAAAEEQRQRPFEGTMIDAVGQLDELLRDAVRLRMISDVPLGAFLSGGIDSSLTVALMQAQSEERVRTFTVGFTEAAYNEAAYARRIADHLGTDHTEIVLSASDALDVIPKLPRIYDEPFADSSQIPTFLICREARRGVTVALSGDGGDEGFCGYNRYVWWRQLWRAVHRLPPSARRLVGGTLGALKPSTIDRVVSPFMRFLPAHLRYELPGVKLSKAAAVIGVESPAELYFRLISHWLEPAALVVGGQEPDDGRFRNPGPMDIDRFTEHMAVLDLQNYLPDDILVKVDRASMAVSLEVRAPLLDYRVLEFGMSLPIGLKLEGTTGKRVLRGVLQRYVPAEMYERAKTGFGIPLDEWLRGPLRDWAEALLSPARLRAEGYFHVEKIRRVWDDHVSGEKSSPYHLWDVLMFQAWLDSTASH